MAADRNDAAYAYVVAANEKEIRNRARADQRKARAENQHPAWFYLAAVLGVGVAWMYFDEGNDALGAVWAAFAGCHAILGLRQRAKRLRRAEGRDADARCGKAANQE